MNEHKRMPVVKYESKTSPISCPYGLTTRVLTGGEGGIANVHVISVTKGDPHRHEGYDEVYYVLAGRGEIQIDGKAYTLEPGAVVSIPRGSVHSLCADGDEPLRFVAFGTPAMSADDPRFTPRP